MINKKINKNDFDSCSECGGEIIPTGHERICNQCGLVIDEIYSSASYIAHDDDRSGGFRQAVAIGERPNFVGGLGTLIGHAKSKLLKDKSKKLLSPDKQKTFQRLKKYYSQFLNIEGHETEYRMFKLLDAISKRLNLGSDICNYIAYNYSKILKCEKKIPNSVTLIAFLIFYATKKDRIPITIKEICKSFTDLNHWVTPRLILKNGFKYKKYLMKDVKPHKTEDYIIRVIDNVFQNKEVNEKLIQANFIWGKEEFKRRLIIKCREILNDLPLSQRGGRKPYLLTGAIIFLAGEILCRDNNQKKILTQALISQSTDIPVDSLRDHYINLLKPRYYNKVLYNYDAYIIKNIKAVFKDKKKIKERLTQKGCTWEENKFKKELVKKSQEILNNLPLSQFKGKSPYIFSSVIINLADKSLSEKYNQKKVLTLGIISHAAKVRINSLNYYYQKLRESLRL